MNPQTLYRRPVFVKNVCRMYTCKLVYVSTGAEPFDRTAATYNAIPITPAHSNTAYQNRRLGIARVVNMM